MKGGTAYLGVIFKVNAITGALTQVVEFTVTAGLNPGAYPTSELVSDGTGFLWGTTQAGTLFKVNRSTGELTTVLDFNIETGSKKGNLPYAGLVSDGAGFLWGTTQFGGRGHGTLFKLDERTGALTTLVEFTNDGPSNRGAQPRAQLVNDGAGFLWGSTSEGGDANDGTLFRVKIDTGESMMFVEFSDHRGARPNAELVSDGDGLFWGTTHEGGVEDAGTILSERDYRCADHSGGVHATTSTAAVVPHAALISDGAGFFWGNDQSRRTYDDGTIFQINASTGKLTTDGGVQWDRYTQQGQGTPREADQRRGGLSLGDDQ